MCLLYIIADFLHVSCLNLNVVAASELVHAFKAGSTFDVGFPGLPATHHTIDMIVVLVM